MRYKLLNIALQAAIMLLILGLAMRKLMQKLLKGR